MIKLAVMKNLACTQQGFIGLSYDNYLPSGGPVELQIWFYFFAITIDIGPQFKKGEINDEKNI